MSAVDGSPPQPKSDNFTKKVQMPKSRKKTPKMGRPPVVSGKGRRIQVWIGEDVAADIDLRRGDRGVSEFVRDALSDWLRTHSD